MEKIWLDINGTPHKNIIGDDKLVAKQTGDQYQVLASTEGDIFNPRNTSNNINKKDKIRGGRYFFLQRCSRDCYIYYVQFLRSKNYTHYLLAQRRLKSE